MVLIGENHRVSGCIEHWGELLSLATVKRRSSLWIRLELPRLTVQNLVKFGSRVLTRWVDKFCKLNGVFGIKFLNSRAGFFCFIRH